MANIKGIKVDLAIKDNATGQYYRIPVLPETIAYGDGDAIKDTVKVIDLGNVDFPSGVDLDNMGWSSFFPVSYDPGYCSTSSFLIPIAYRNLFSTWKDQGTSLQLICPAASINKNMVLYSFKWELKGFEGEIYYTVEFKERKVLKPAKVALAAKIPQKTKAGPTNRDPVPEKAKASTYTVKSGDTLSGIAKKLDIADWHTIYNNNKAVIGANPNLIRVGQVYNV